MLNKYKLKDIVLHSHDLIGIYAGIVVDDDDPGYKEDGFPLSRVKVNIPELTEGIPVEHLPWYSIKQAVNDSPNSQSKKPPVGSNVIVEFPDNSIYNGLVSYVLVSHAPI